MAPSGPSSSTNPEKAWLLHDLCPTLVQLLVTIFHRVQRCSSKNMKVVVKDNLVKICFRIAKRMLAVADFLKLCSIVIVSLVAFLMPK